MIKPVYTIRDIKTGVFESPMIHQNDQTAIRFFTQCLHQVPVMQNNPQDFELFVIGEFNEDTGLISGTDSVQFLISGINCLELTRQEIKNNETQESSTQVSNDASI